MHTQLDNLLALYYLRPSLIGNAVTGFFLSMAYAMLVCAVRRRDCLSVTRFAL
jgi:hypothetical protein